MSLCWHPLTESCGGGGVRGGRVNRASGGAAPRETVGLGCQASRSLPTSFPGLSNLSIFSDFAGHRGATQLLPFL